MKKFVSSLLLTTFLMNPLLAVGPKEDEAKSSPARLSLATSLTLADLSKDLAADSTAQKLNNIFTNIAYLEAMDAYAQHGDKFIEPFTNNLIARVIQFGESSALTLTGLNDAHRFLHQTTGQSVTSSNAIARAIVERGSADFINFCRLKFLTDWMNRNIIAPQVAGPAAAYVVDQIKIGNLFQSHVFKAFKASCTDEAFLAKLQIQSLEEKALLTKELEAKGSVSFDVELSSINQRIADQQSKVDEEAKGRYRLSTALFHTENTRELANLQNEKVALEKRISTHQNKIVALETQIQSLSDGLARYDARRQESSLSPGGSDLKLFQGLKYKGKDFQDLLERCPGLESGWMAHYMTPENCGFIARHAIAALQGYLRLTGVTPSVLTLKSNGIRALDNTREDLLSLKDGLQSQWNSFKSTIKFTPEKDDLEGSGVIGTSVQYVKSAVAGTVKMAWTALEATSQVSDVCKRLEERKEDVYSQSHNVAIAVSRALIPVHFAARTLKYSSMAWAANYAAFHIMGTTLTSSNSVPGMTMAAAEIVYDFFQLWLNRP